MLAATQLSTEPHYVGLQATLNEVLKLLHAEHLLVCVLTVAVVLEINVLVVISRDEAGTVLFAMLKRR